MHNWFWYKNGIRGVAPQVMTYSETSLYGHSQDTDTPEVWTDIYVLTEAI